MVDDAASLAHQRDGVREKAVRRGAAPLRVAGREVRADIPVRQSPEDRVRQGVQDHVAVGMRLDTAIMGDPHAAEPDMIAFREGVNVEAGAQTCQQGHGASFQAILGGLNVRLMGQFHVSTWPSKTWTGRPAHSTSAPSSVKA